MSFVRFAWVCSLAFTLVACFSTSDNDDVCEPRSRCDTGTPSGPTHGLTPDGRVDVSAAEAWPNRPAEPAPLTPLEVAQACTLIGACAAPDPSGDPAKTDFGRALATTLCAKPHFDEERAIPRLDTNERWTFEARAIIAAAGNCAALADVRTTRPEGVFCEEVGCWWTSRSLPVPSVTCDGAVATLVTAGKRFVRDCARAFQRCDPDSGTGCSDRRPVACENPAKDRCDGDIKLGCDSTGRVSFRDCSRGGGTCVETSEGASCVYPDAGLCDETNITCEGSVLSVCVGGAPVAADCATLGLVGCAAGHCTAQSG